MINLIKHFLSILDEFLINLMKLNDRIVNNSYVYVGKDVIEWRKRL